MITLRNFLENNKTESSLREIIIAISKACKYVNAEIRMKDMDKCGDQNASGDTQSTLDVESDRIVEYHLEDTKLVKTIASEEKKDVVQHPNLDSEYFVAYDPYDGGSVGDANITFGSIFGIWNKNPLKDKLRNSMVAGCYALYGPKVTFMLAIDSENMAMFELNEVGDFILLRTEFNIKEDIEMFLPGNLKATLDSKNYKDAVDEWIANGKKLRYSGALVTDINHILIKGNGIFTYPSDSSHPNGRLRLLYEGAPLGYILECAGGVATDELGDNLIDKELKDYHQTSSFVLGSKNEVIKFTDKFKA